MRSFSRSSSLMVKVCYIELQRARDLFYALWIPDLFMRRCEADGMWSLMCPNECPGLQDCWGEKFDKLYERYSFYFGHIRQRDVSVHSTDVDIICDLSRERSQRLVVLSREAVK